MEDTNDSFDFLYFGMGVGIGVTALLIAFVMLLYKCSSGNNDDSNDKKQTKVSKQMKISVIAPPKTKERVATVSSHKVVNSLNSGSLDINMDDMVVAMSVDLPYNEFEELEIARDRSNNLRVDRDDSTDEGLWDKPKDRLSTCTSITDRGSTDRGEVFDTKDIDFSE